MNNCSRLTCTGVLLGVSAATEVMNTPTRLPEAGFVAARELAVRPSSSGGFHAYQTTGSGHGGQPTLHH